MNNAELANQILTLVGGKDNVISLKHCATRLRFQLKSKDVVKNDELKALEGVAGTKDQDGGIQVIIGTNVTDIYDELYKISDFSGNTDAAPAKESDGKKKNIVVRALNTITDVMVPILPILVATGLTSALLTLLQALGLINTESTLYSVLDILASAPLSFVPIMVAISAAKKFKVNPYIAAGVMACLLYSGFSALDAAGTGYAYLFNVIPIRIVDYSGSIIPALLMVWCQIYLEKVVHKYTPKLVSVFVEPLVEFIVLAILTMVVFGPLGAYIGDGITAFINFGLVHCKWLICLLLGAFGSVIVATGMHYSMMSFIIMNYMANGYDNFYAGVSFSGAMALAGAVLAAAFVSKNRATKQLASSTGFTALMGVSEPALYGVFFRFRSVLISTCIAGGIGGLLSSFLGVNSYGLAPSGLASIAIFVGDTFWNAIICMVVSFVIGFALVCVTFKDDMPADIAAKKEKA